MCPCVVDVELQEDPVIDVDLDDGNNIDVPCDTNIVVRGSDNYEDLHNKPSINGVELVGAITSRDLGIDQTFVYEQNTLSDEWTIDHNLGRFPSVSVIDSAGTVVVGDVRYLNENTIVCSFNAPFIGTAYLN